MNIWVTTFVYYFKSIVITLLIIAITNFILVKIKIKGETLFEIISKTKRRRKIVCIILFSLIIVVTTIFRKSTDYWSSMLFAIVFTISFVALKKLFSVIKNHYKKS